MRRAILTVSLSAGLLALGACSTLGERSTVAQLDSRCDARGGTLTPGNSAAEGGYRCHGTSINAAASSAASGRARAGGQLNSAIDRSLRGT